MTKSLSNYDQKIPCWYYLASFLTFVTILLVEPSYSEAYFEYSTWTYIPAQQEMATKGGQLGWEIYSNYALPLALFAPIFYSLWHYEERKRAVYYVTVLTAIVFTMNVSKLWYH